MADAPDAVLDPGRLAALRATRLLDSPPEPEFDRATNVTARLLGLPVTLVDADRQFFKSARGLPEPWASRRETPLSHSFCKHVVQGGVPLVVEDARLDKRVRTNGAVRDLGVVAYLGVPLRSAEGDVLGALCAISGESRRWEAVEVEAVEDLARMLETEMALRRAATTDPLTGIANRRGFDAQLDAALAAAGRPGAPPGTALMMLDLDRFKPINDTYGHEAGDAVLRAVAERLQHVAGYRHCAARLGGDEFALLVGGAPEPQAIRALAQDVSAAVAQPVDFGGTAIQVGTSVGVAWAFAGTTTRSALMADADGALYLAKAERRRLNLR